MELVLSGIWTVFLLVLIVVACTIFTNGIEWLGHRFKLSEGAVGSVLAAVGTALPETLVPIVALVSGSLAATGISKSEGHDIGMGAILGAPFLLSTLAMFVTAIAVFYYTVRKKRSLDLKLDLHLFRRDLHYFFLAYGLVLAAGFIPNPPVKILMALFLLVFYGVYVYRTLKKEHIPDEEFHIDPLMLAPKSQEPPTLLIMIQVFGGLLGIILMAHLFVDQIKHLSVLLEIHALILSLVIVPIATELPEKFNSVVWIGKRRDNLALGNITGAMVFQSCIPPAIGLVFTPWNLNFQGFLSVGLCLASSALMYVSGTLRGKLLPHVLLLGGAFYLVFIFYSFSPWAGTGKAGLP